TPAGQGLSSDLRAGRFDQRAGRHAALVRHGTGSGIHRDPVVQQPRGLGAAVLGNRYRGALSEIRVIAARAIVTDIEGTTSAISFVRDVLFPYADQHLDAYVAAHRNDPVVAHALREAAVE